MFPHACVAMEALAEANEVLVGFDDAAIHGIEDDGFGERSEDAAKNRDSLPQRHNDVQAKI
jgi:hypothetical protein